jgi:hypothetical protein
MTPDEPEITLGTLHGDLGAMRGDIADLKTTMIKGFAGMPTRAQSDEMLRVLREGNRRTDERLAELDVRGREQHLELDRRIREQHLETQQALRALTESQHTLSTDVTRLIARIDAIIRGRNNGEPSS